MYYEEAEVKEYYRKDSKGNKKPYYQIGIKKKSKFNEAKPIGLIDISEIKQIEKELNPTYRKEQEAKLNELSEEIIQLKQQVKELKEENTELTSVNYNLQQELLTIKEDHENKIEDITSKLLHEKDLVKSLLVVRSDFLKQGRLKRFLKVEPESSKKVAEIKELPEDIEIKDISES